MAVASLKKEKPVPKWDKPLAILLVLLALAFVALFIMNYGGPPTAVVP